MSIILPLIKVCCIFSSAHLFWWQRYDSNTWVIKALLPNLYFLNIGVFHQCLLYFIDVQIYLGPSLTSFLLSSINNLPYLQISNLLCLDFLIFKYFKNKLSFSAWGIFYYYYYTYTNIGYIIVWLNFFFFFFFCLRKSLIELEYSCKVIYCAKLCYYNWQHNYQNY